MATGWCYAFRILLDFSPRGWMGESMMRKPDGKARGCGRRMPREPYFTWKAGRERTARCCTSSFDRIHWRIDASEDARLQKTIVYRTMISLRAIGALENGARYHW